MPHFLDLERWPRRPAFEFFKSYDNPYFNICASLTVTELVELSRSRAELSFSSACLFGALGAANEYEPFRYRMQGGRVWVHDVLHAATTTLVDEERLAFIYFDYASDLLTFQSNAARATQALEKEAAIIDDCADRSDLIHFSSLPWVSFTSISHARNWRREDSVPKITFGRYQIADGRATMPISIEVHHALMDGLHVARYLELVQQRFANPETMLSHG